MHFFHVNYNFQQIKVFSILIPDCKMVFTSEQAKALETAYKINPKIQKHEAAILGSELGLNSNQAFPSLIPFIRLSNGSSASEEILPRAHPLNVLDLPRRNWRRKSQRKKS
jgi:hypothetical protein